ncbi:MAG: mechanosensitive ion channel family protein [Gemmatimonadetes bacterium]|nr:mechanosensitive ion channel family protein [Gemmatimonadota bacterium]
MDDLKQLLDMEKIANEIVAFLPNLAAALIVLGLFVSIYWITNKPLRLGLKRAGIDHTLVRLLVSNVYKFTVVGFGVVMAAGQVGINIGAALAGIGVAGIAIGFAAKDSLANTIAGFLIFWDKPFVVGDWVTVADQYGRVANITLRSTRIRTNRNTYVIIPNQKIIDEVLTNHSKNGNTRIDVPVGIGYGESVSEARRTLLQCVAGHGDVLDDPPPAVVVNGLGASSVDLLVQVWIGESEKERRVYREVTEMTKSALDKAEIEIPFPQRTLHVSESVRIAS